MANAAFLAEKNAKEVAEGKLARLRRSITHKDELLKTLKAKVWTHAPIIHKTCLQAAMPSKVIGPSVVGWLQDCLGGFACPQRCLQLLFGL